MDAVIRDTIEMSHLFETLSDSHKEQLAANATLLELGEGDVIVAEGTTVASLFLVVEGIVRVSTQSMAREVELKKLGTGSYFGEVSLLSGKEATATVEAFKEVKLVAIERDAVLDVLSQNEGVRRILEGVTLARAKDTIAKVLK